MSIQSLKSAPVAPAQPPELDAGTFLKMEMAGTLLTFQELAQNGRLALAQPLATPPPGADTAAPLLTSKMGDDVISCFRLDDKSYVRVQPPQGPAIWYSRDALEAARTQTRPPAGPESSFEH